MRRVIALALAVGLLCSLTSALALDVPKHIDDLDGLPYLPRLSDFAQMRTRQEDEIVTIYLDKPVDNLRANWLEYNNEHEEDLEVEEVDDMFVAYLDTTGHKYQVGAHWTNAYAYETYTENDGTKDETIYQTMLRQSDADEGKNVGDTMAQRNTLKEVNSSTGKSSDTSVQKNDSAVDELKGFLSNDQPEKFQKYEITFNYNPSSPKTSNKQIEADIKTLTAKAQQDAKRATDALGQTHYDKYGNRADLQNYYCVKVEEPFYAVVKTLDDGRFCILSRYKYDTGLSKIAKEMPSGYKLYRVNGYVTAWHPTYAASDGTSDGRYTVAYLSDQTIDGETWTVAYGRNGKIQWFYLTMYDTELFEQDMGTSIIKFEPCNTGWFIREVTEMYEDGSYVSAFFNRTGNGKLAYYKASEFFESGTSPYSNRNKKNEDPDDDLDDWDDDFNDLDDDDFPDDDDLLDDDEPYYLVYEEDDGNSGVLHKTDCPVVKKRDVNDWHWQSYGESELDMLLSMYDPCEECMSEYIYNDEDDIDEDDNDFELEDEDLSDAELTEGEIIDRLYLLPDIGNIAAVTEDNDPDGLLNKQGGYIAQIYFSSPLVDPAYEGDYDLDVISEGTDCGGSIEVYATAEDAKRRDRYLSVFDGGALSSGSHTVVGTMIIRTSSRLTASDQKKLEAEIIEALFE